MFMTRFSIHAFEPDLSIHVCSSLHPTHSRLTTYWVASDNFRSAYPDPRAWIMVDFLLIGVAQQKRGSSADHPELFSSWPPARLSSFLFVTRKRILYCSLLYISLYSRIYVYQVMLYFNIVSHPMITL